MSVGVFSDFYICLVIFIYLMYIKMYYIDFEGYIFLGNCFINGDIRFYLVRIYEVCVFVI